MDGKAMKRDVKRSWLDCKLGSYPQKEEASKAGSSSKSVPRVTSTRFGRTNNHIETSVISKWKRSNQPTYVERNCSLVANQGQTRSPECPDPRAILLQKTTKKRSRVSKVSWPANDISHIRNIAKSLADPASDLAFSQIQKGPT